MSFIAKNPLIIPEVNAPSSIPKVGTRGLFAGKDGWYDVDANNKKRKIATTDDINHGGGSGGIPETSDGGIILNDYETNQAISKNTLSVGYGNIAGGKGFKIIDCSDNGDGTGTYTLSSVDGLVADGSMTYNVRLSTASYNVGVITAINGNVVTVTNYPNIALETDADEPENFNIENYLTITGRPDLGDTDIGFNSFAGGQSNITQDKNTFSFGKGNKTIGQFGAALGRDNISGYGCLVGGRGNIVPVICGFGSGQSNRIYSDYSVGFGYNNTINKGALHSNVFGIHNIINGYGASAIGRGLIASSDYQVVLGRYNIEDAEYINNVFVIGGGTSEGDRKNLLTLDGNGTLTVSNKIIVGNKPLSAVALSNDYNVLYNKPVTAGSHENQNGVAGANGVSEGQFATSFGHGCNSKQNHCFSTGLRAISDGYAAISIGTDSEATDDFAVAIGRGVKAVQQDQFARGKYNLEMSADYLDIVGNGNGNSNRSNAYTLDKNGNGWFAGDVKAGEISLSGINAKTGDLENLETNDKSSIVNAINEIAEEHGQDIAEMSDKINEIYNASANYGDSKIKPSDSSLFVFTELDDGTLSVAAVNSDIGGEIVIPYEYDGKVISVVADYGFQNCTNITKVTIPNTVTTLGICAFIQCSNLKDIIIPVSVTKIMHFALDSYYNDGDFVDIYYKGSKEQWDRIDIYGEDNYIISNATKYFNFGEVEDLTKLQTDDSSSLVSAVNEITAKIKNIRNIEVDQDYDSDSKNAQSGKAVSQAVNLVNLAFDVAKEQIELDIDNLNAHMGDLQNLDTVNKVSVVDAINEVRSEIDQDRIVQSQNTSNIDTLMSQMGDIDTALDNIIAIQNSYIGGDSV